MRLIDADALKGAFLEELFVKSGKSVQDIIDEAPTIKPRVSIDQRELCEDINCEDCPFMQDTCKLLDAFAEPSGETTETRFYDNNGEVYATITKAKPSGDLISRADTLAKIKEYCIDGDAVVQNWFDTMGIEEVINTMPSVSADRPQVNSAEWVAEKEFEELNRPKGEWMHKTSDESVCEEWECSQCGCEVIYKADFCPSCGADMRKDQDR